MAIVVRHASSSTRLPNIRRRPARLAIQIDLGASFQGEALPKISSRRLCRFSINFSAGAMTSLARSSSKWPLSVKRTGSSTRSYTSKSRNIDQSLRFSSRIGTKGISYRSTVAVISCGTDGPLRSTITKRARLANVLIVSVYVLDSGRGKSNSGGR
jgi:hypothetical protein